MGIRPSLALLLATACQGSPSNHSGFGSTPEMTTGAASSGEGSTAASTGTSSGTTGGAGSASTSTSSDNAGETAVSTFDLGGSPDIGDGKPVGCKGKIDFLFVISRDYGMKLVQEQLIAAFPDFIATIQDKFADFDYHIMVVDGEPEWGLSYCTDDCPKPFDQCGVEDYPCDKLNLVTECDATLGAGNVFAAGGSATNEPCAVDGSRRFLTRDQTDLDKTFACIAQLGISGRGWIGEALTAAVSPQLNWKGACNEGFLRDDALLMVTLVDWTYDEEGKPNGSAGTPQDWAQAVLAAKHGDPESVVMLSILDPACPWYDRTCEMAKMFPYSYIGENWQVDYGPQFAEASDLVEVACEGFLPPG